MFVITKQVDTQKLEASFRSMEGGHDDIYYREKERRKKGKFGIESSNTLRNNLMKIDKEKTIKITALPVCSVFSSWPAGEQWLQVQKHLGNVTGERQELGVGWRNEER